MKKSLFLVLFVSLFTFSGCVGELMLAGTAVSAASTAQEVEDEHNGDFFEYVGEKYQSLKSYIKRKVN